MKSAFNGDIAGQVRNDESITRSILIINGVNLNLLGKREVAIYGNTLFEEQLSQWKALYLTFSIDYFQSNEEDAIVKKIQEAEKKHTAIVINGGAFTHTSIAIADAIRAITIPAIEVHISNIYAREEYRKKSFLSPVCKGSIVGLGLDSYRLAIEHVINVSLEHYDDKQKKVRST